MRNVAIFASGNGTNAEAVILELLRSDETEVSVVITNNPNAGVIARAKNAQVPVEMIDQKGQDSEEILDVLGQYDTDIILLLGYLRLLPSEVISKYDGHILNLHPALLPKYGGKGMYGSRVHAAVAASGDTQTGFSLHRVNPIYDDGEVLFQATTPIHEESAPEEIEQIERKLEAEQVAPAINELIETNQI